MKQWRSVLIGVVISAVTLWLVLKDIDFAQLGNALATANLFWILPCVALTVIALGMRAFRWKGLLDDKITINHSFHILNASYLLNTFLPLRLGEVVRAFMVTRLTPPLSMFTAISTVVVERLIDIIAVVVLIIIAMLIRPVSQQVANAAGLFGVLSIVGIIVLTVVAARPAIAHTMLNLALRIVPFLKRLGLDKLLDRVLDGIRPLGRPKGAAVNYGWTAIAWATSALTAYSLMPMFYPNPPLNAAILVIALGALAVALPAAPGNVGLFELSVIEGLRLSGMIAANDSASYATALAYAVVLHFISVLVYAGLGFWGLSAEKISLGDVVKAARQAAAKLGKGSTGTAEPATVSAPTPNVPAPRVRTSED